MMRVEVMVPGSADVAGRSARPSVMTGAAMTGPRNAAAMRRPAAAGATDVDVLPAWVRYDVLTWVPTLDATSRKFQAAWHAIEAGDACMARGKLRSLAADLKGLAVAAASDNAPLSASDQRWMQGYSWRLAACALRAGLAAAAIDSGEMRDLADFRRVFTQETVLDMDSRWRFVDHTIWFPACAASDRHFCLAARAAAANDRAQSAMEIGKAVGFARLEAARAHGYPRRMLDAAIARLRDAARDDRDGSDEPGPVLDPLFAFTQIALCTAHRSRAAEYWLRGDRQRAGYDFIAAAENLRHAARWARAGGEPVHAIVAMELSMLGRRLATGDAPCRSDVVDAIGALGSSIDTLRRRSDAGARSGRRSAPLASMSEPAEPVGHPPW